MSVSKQYYSVGELAGILKGRVVGDSQAIVYDFAKIEEGKPGTLTFLANMKYEEYIYSTEATVVLVNEGFEPKHPIQANLIYVKNAYASLAQLMRMVEEQRKQQKKNRVSWFTRIKKSAKIGKGCRISSFSFISTNSVIGDRCVIFPHVYIGNNVHIGDDVTLYPGTRIMDDCVIGNRCVLQPNSVVGAEGFGFAPENGEYKKIPQIGNVVLEDDVEIGANACVDRATMGSTIIRRGSKIDNLVQIAHNVEVGEHTVMAAQTGIAGSTKIGHHCQFGGQAGLINHLVIGNNVRVAAQSGVLRNVEDNEIVMGYPATKAISYNRSAVVAQRLPEMYRDLNDLKKEMEALKKQLSEKE